jgi:hypothetical protein
MKSLASVSLHDPDKSAGQPIRTAEGRLWVDVQGRTAVKAAAMVPPEHELRRVLCQHRATLE